MNVFDQFNQYALQKYPVEAVAAIYGDELITLQNVAKDPCTDFEVNGVTYLNMILEHGREPDAIVHSHTHTDVRYDMNGFVIDPRTPSYADMQSCEAANVPYAIVYCNGSTCLEPVWLGVPSDKPLLGRTYIYGITDCVTIVRDFYHQVLGITLTDIPRKFDWSEGDKRLIDTTFAQKGFVETGITDLNDLQKGDVLIIQMRGTDFNSHCGVYPGDGSEDFIHHVMDEKSCVSSLVPYHKYIKKILRLK